MSLLNMEFKTTARKTSTMVIFGPIWKEYIMNVCYGVKFEQINFSATVPNLWRSKYLWKQSSCPE